MRRALPFLLILALVGCKGSRESEIVGNWTSGRGIKYAFDVSKTFQVSVRSVSESGTWSIDGDVVTATLTQVNGKPIAELRSQLLSRKATLTPRLQAMAENLGKPENFTLSKDGKTMTKKGAEANPVILTKG